MLSPIATGIVLRRSFTRYSQALLQKAKANDTKDGPKEFYNEHFKVKYKRLEINDKDFIRLMSLVKSKRMLEKDFQIVVEGKKLICEAVEANLKLNHLLFSHLEKIKEVVDVMGNSTSHINFLRVPQQDLSQWSVLTTCPGIIGLFDKPKAVEVKKESLPITIICDNIREPNNVGAVVRLANALPASKVLLPKGNGDVWDTKAIRGSSGSVFHIPTEGNLTWEQIDEIVPYDNSVVLLADNNNNDYVPSALFNYDSIPEEKIAGKDIYVVIGGETHGISREAKQFAYNRSWAACHVPLDASVESLNTSNALAIILFELRRSLSKIQ